MKVRLYTLFLSLFSIIFAVDIQALENGEYLKNNAFYQSLNSSGSDLHSQILLGEEMFLLKRFDESREIFERLLNKDMKNPQAHLYLGFIEYENGNFEKAKTRFQIAYECLGDTRDVVYIPDSNQIQLEFADRSDVRLYNKDGWYLRQKDRVENQSLLLLDSGSNYKILFKPEDKISLLSKIVVGSAIALSFLFVR